MQTSQRRRRAAARHSRGFGEVAAIGTGLFFIFSAPLAHAQSDVTLTLGPVNDQNVKVTFLPADGASIGKPPDAELRDMPEAQTHSYKLYVDLAHIGPNKFANQFIYTLYAHDASQPSDKAWLRFEVKSDTGNFVDAREDVHFTLKRGGNLEEGTIPLPLHSFGDQPLVNISLAESPAPVSVSSEQDIVLNVQNLTSTLAIRILDPAQLILDNQPVWNTRAGPLSVNGGASLHPGASSTLSIHVNANKMPALFSTLHASGPNRSHDTIKLLFNCVAEQGGAMKTTAPLSIPVRFEPSLFSLFLALLIGSMFATILSRAVQQALKNWRALLRQILISIGLSIAVEAFGMFLVQVNSKLVLVGYEVDPWQVLPASFIGFFASGGKQLLDYVGAKKSAAAGAAGQGGGMGAG